MIKRFLLRLYPAAARNARRRRRAATKLEFESLEARELLATAPAPWMLHDVGTVDVAYQSMTLTPGADGLVASIATQGATGVGGTADDVRFLYQQMVGDGEISARVDSVSSDDWFAAAGVMIRESLNADAKNVSVLNWSAGATILAARDAPAGVTTPEATSWGDGPRYVKLVRAGNNFTGYHSADGAAWTQLGAAQTIAMGQTVYVGLAASAGLDAPETSTAKLSRIVAPQAVVSQPIGSAPVGLVAKYSAEWGAWTAGMEQSGPFRYLWNAPDGWQPGVGAPSWNSGAVSDVDNFQELYFVQNVNGVFDAFKVDPDGLLTDTDPAQSLRLRDGLAYPGGVAGHVGAGGLANGFDRYAIVAYTVPNLDPNVDEGGFFTIEDSFLSKKSSNGDGLEVLVFTSNDPTKPIVRTYSNALASGASADSEVVDFDGFLGYVPEGGTIYVAVGADDSTSSDEGGFDFSIWRSKPIEVAALSDESPSQGAGESQVTSFAAPQSGLYGLHDAWAWLTTLNAGTVEARVYVGDRLINSKPVVVAPGFGAEHFSMELGYVPQGETISVTFEGSPAALDSLAFDFNVVEYAPRQAPLRASDLTPTLVINVPPPVFSSPGVQNAIQNHANIQAALTQARNHTEGAANAGKAAVVKLAANQTYELDKTGIVLNSSSQQYLFSLNGYERVVFDGQDSTLLIKNAQVGLFLARQDGSNVTEKLVFQNFTIDFHEDALPFTQGVIHSVAQLDGNSVKVKFDVDLNLYDSPLDPRFTPASNSGYMYELDENGLATGRMIDGSWTSWVADNSYSSQSIVHEAGDPANRFTHFVTRSPGISVLVNEGPGSGWLVRTRNNSNFYLVNANWITLDNVTSWAGSGTFVSYFQTSNVSILNSSLELKPGSNRYVSSSADALHGRGRDGLWVENSKFEAAGDDLFNAYGLNFVLKSQPNGTTLNLGMFSTSNPSTPNNFDARDFKVGDQLAFFNPPTGAVLGRRYITAINAAAQTVTLDAPITGLPLFNGSAGETNMMVMNVDAVANYFVRDSEFLNSFRYGMFLKANDVYVMGNTFKGGLEAAIFAVNEPSWPEGFLAERVRIQDNLFEDNGRGAMSRNRYYLAKDPGTVVIGTYRNATGSTSADAYVTGLSQQSHFLVLDNVFNDWRGMGVSVRNSRDVTISGNVFNASVNDAALRTVLDSTSSTPGGGTVSPGPPLYDVDDASGKYAAIYLHDLDGVIIGENTFNHRDDVLGNIDDEDFDLTWLDAAIDHLLLEDL